jgi:hypothetical protein
MAAGVKARDAGIDTARAGQLDSKSTGERRTGQMLKNMIFYSVVGGIIAAVLQAFNADLGVVLFASLIGPPILLLAIRIIRYN